MPLHPQAQAVIDGVAAMGLPPFDENMSPEQARQIIDGFGSFMVPSEEVASVLDTIAPGPEVDVPLRIYMPAEGPEDEELRPGIFFFHGGGFVTGSVDLVDPLCRRVANRSGCAVIGVGYRLAPEHPYPAAVSDAYIATAWIHAKGPAFGIDNDHLAVMGDSAGANLATVTCMMLRDKGEAASLSLQVLVCPALDMVNAETPSRRDFGEGHVLTTEMMDWFAGHYLRGREDQADEPYCSPVRANSLSRLPPAIIVTAEYDPLRDEGQAYAELLKDEGTFVDLRPEKGMVHMFHWMGGVIDRGREVLDELAADISTTLRSGA